ncbi:MAG: WXG100 family type VII secretion target [Lachnospiraceae bacterium]|nr:WXG100 family type VII secretion target [Lachnospiraceae bacterium]
MASTIFDVTPEELEASATKIETKTGEFTKAYNSIYTAVSDLRVNYKGEASDTFNQRIEGYKNDFTAAEKALKNYVQFLRDYASEMRSTENTLKDKASALSVGK